MSIALILVCLALQLFQPALAQYSLPQDQMSIPPVQDGGLPVTIPTPQNGGAPGTVPPAQQDNAPLTLPPVDPTPLPPSDAGAMPPQSDNGGPNTPLYVGPDLTERLTLRKGMRIVFPIKNGLDTRWQLVGNYNFIADIEYNDQRGYRFDWQMTSPANVQGLRAVEPEDIREAYKVSLFYPANESQSLIGFTSIVRISDFLYQRLKSGEVVQFATDGPDSPLVMKRETRAVAHEIRAEGIDKVTVEIDGVHAPVRAIKARTDVGWTYWILDNPRFPIMLAGTGPFQWADLKFSNTGIIKAKKSPGGAGGDLNKAKREADNVIKQLKSKGQATSYLILFDFDSDKLRPLSQQILDELSKYLLDNPTLRLTVEGHTCNVGGKDYNLKLSSRRADSVKNYLEHCGVAEHKLKPIGYGFSKPIASNKTSAGRAKNRRVVFTEIK
jgi:outer membrane protein OmpA-like peptidoglycan-associated protein